ncbi:MAG: MGMT family protein [Gemmatimonadales bacterium]|nr:MGMT family protein [Gemmatimonadales bacterium]
MSDRRARIYAAVRRIPAGEVRSYAEVARMARVPNGARQVGYALAALEVDSAVPWHRVVNATGAISPRGDGAAAITQRLRLEAEGVRFDARGRAIRPARRA